MLYIIMSKEQKKPKLGMYGEMPKIQIGKYSICMYTDDKNEDKIWIEDEDGDGGVFVAKKFENVIEDKYNELF